VWAVGGDGDTVHWDGSSWIQIPSALNVWLNGVKAISQTNAWAVGNWNSEGSPRDPLRIMHWNGTSWSRYTGVRAEPCILNGVAINPVTHRGWAVGWASGHILILRWNGTDWVRTGT